MFGAQNEGKLSSGHHIWSFGNSTIYLLSIATAAFSL
jgi:hypothetical protein